MPEISRAADRMPALDFTKGALVLIMILYHWLNYFVSTDGDYYRYLRFLTPSFIFITGFLISHVYLGAGRRQQRDLPVRLFVRGVKLLVVFAVLNLVRALVIVDARNQLMTGGLWSAVDVWAIFVTGNVGIAGDKTSSFNILVPIAYLLILSAMLVVVRTTVPHVFQIVAIIGFVAVVALRMADIELGHVNLIVVGLLGVFVGFAPIHKIDAIASHWIPVAALYVVYTGLVAVFGVNYWLQTIGVLVCTLLIYAAGKWNGEYGVVRRTVGLLGKYSLYSYIAQIGILQVLSRIAAKGGLTDVELVCSLIGALLLTVWSVQVLAWIRPRFAPVDRIYRTVFM